MIASSDFKPDWYLRNPHLQTLAANLIKPAKPVVSYESIDLSDGDQLTLAHGTADGSDRVLVLHGLEGSLDSAYARRVISHLNHHNVPVTLMFFRGCDGKVNRLARSYHSGDTGDLKQVIHHLASNGTRRLALLGYSLGGNVTLKYLGEGETHRSIVCGTAVSVPMRLDICAKRMDQGFSRIYQHELLHRLKTKLQHKRELLQQAGFNPDTPARNFFDFDDAFTAPLHGFDNAIHYYEQCSSRQFLKHIKKPTLIIHAIDDPFMTEQVVPSEEELSPQVKLELSDHGGHVGFIERGFLKQQNWLESRIHRWLEAEFIQSSAP